MEWKRAFTVGRAAVLVPTSYPTSILSPPIVQSSYSPFPMSMYLVPLLFHHPLKIGGGLRGTHHRKKALEGDQELSQLLLIRKRPLLAMRPANSGGEGERLFCPVEIKVGGGRGVHRGEENIGLVLSVDEVWMRKHHQVEFSFLNGT
jgi:hypothetical protein